MERWLEEMWSWMLKFKDAVSRIALEVLLKALVITFWLSEVQYAFVEIDTGFPP